MLVAEHELQDAGELVEVLAGVEQVHDLGGFGEPGGSDVPDPGRAVAGDRELAHVIGAAADAFGFDQVAEDAGGLEGGDVAGEGPVPDRVPVVCFVLGEEEASLTSRVRARPSSPLPSRPAVSFAVMGTPVPSITPRACPAAGTAASAPAFGW